MVRIEVSKEVWLRALSTVRCEVAEKKIGLEMVEPIILWEPVPPWQQQPISGSRILRYQFIAIVKRFFCFITNFRFLRFYFYHIIPNLQARCVIRYMHVLASYLQGIGSVSQFSIHSIIRIRVKCVLASLIFFKIWSL